ncbi:oxygen-dependent coproporphyrinogen oxidase [Inmirania thermothiophila]|nr:oxygen-dependent coproporphyrinogen oxidase [Inmirania thermothiophila]
MGTTWPSDLDVLLEEEAAAFAALQDRFCAAFAALEPAAHFAEEAWSRPEGGGGRTRVMEEGAVLERAAVNWSRVEGAALPAAASARRPGLAGRAFRAAGLSVVVHPRNPYAPASHCNLRLFVVAGEPPAWWFGGGFDLTPCYGFDDDAVAWHRAAREACALLGPEAYPRFKRWCDAYFFLPHRGETRGVGGIFFDDLDAPDPARCRAFVRAVGEAYISTYTAILARRKDHPWGERERAFQLLRRGRYAEFNLLYDRGTRFGLESGGRTESILASMPPLASWRHGWRPRPGSPEAELTRRFLTPRDWLAEAEGAQRDRRHGRGAADAERSGPGGGQHRD